MTAIKDRERLETEAITHRKSFILLLAGILALVVGFGAMGGAVLGVWYTWDQAVAQDIITPDDAVIAETPVRGPFTMWAQADIITQHQLDRTDGLYYAQMDRLIPQVDDSGAVVVDESGETVMVPNDARASWFNATILTTSLSLGVISYALTRLILAC